MLIRVNSSPHSGHFILFQLPNHFSYQSIRTIPTSTFGCSVMLFCRSALASSNWGYSKSETYFAPVFKDFGFDLFSKFTVLTHSSTSFIQTSQEFDSLRIMTSTLPLSSQQKLSRNFINSSKSLAKLKYRVSITVLPPVVVDKFECVFRIYGSVTNHPYRNIHRYIELC